MRINWQFAADKARIKLKRLYPTLYLDLTLRSDALSEIPKDYIDELKKLSHALNWDRLKL